MALPILLRLGANVQGDDSIKFIRASGWHPLAVSAAALVLLSLSVALVANLYKRRRLLLVIKPAVGSGR